MSTTLEQGTRRPHKTKSFLSLFKSYSAKSNYPSSIILPLVTVAVVSEEALAPPTENGSQHPPTSDSPSAPTRVDTSFKKESAASSLEISGRERQYSVTCAVNNEPPAALPSPLELPIRLSSDIATEVMVEHFPESEVKVPPKLWNGGRLDDFLEEVAPLSEFQLPGRDRTSTFFDQDTLWDAIGLKEGSGVSWTETER